LQRFLAISLMCAFAFTSTYGQSESGRSVRIDKASGQLLIQGKPFLILGGELGNSSAGTSAEADATLPEMARLHVNTVLMPVAWEQVEPREGTFDFSILDHWIDVARQQNLHLVLLWFGSWKNAFSEYAPDWVKSDSKRFSRAMGIDGAPLEILSTFGTDSAKCDSLAFAALLKHVRVKDGEQQTVLMVQVENEVGVLGSARDRSPEANRQFAGPVPRELVQKLVANRTEISRELAAHFNPQGKTWREVFGETADEVFMAWSYAAYVDSVSEAGKKEYPLPVYMNAQLPSFLERAGEYPSGGPHPYYLDVYRAVATHIDFYSPDIYWPEFEYWVRSYQIPGNPIFIPEARLESSPYNALYAYGAARAFGFCPFGIDSLKASNSADEPEPGIMQVYAAIESLGPTLTDAQAADRTRGMALHANSPRASQSVVMGGYSFQGSLSRAWSTNALLANDGGMLLLQFAPNEFLIIGAGLTVKMTRDPDTDGQIAGISSIEEVSRIGSEWKVAARLNGDQSNQGRQLTMDPHKVKIYRLRMYAASR
jgi:beta-galactosidase GanA